MEWALAIIFGIAVVLLILSYFLIKKTSKAEHEEMDAMFVSLMEEINQLKDQIRQLELDAEISAHEANIIGIYAKERVLIRELLDLYKRGYTIKGIAEQTQLNEKEVRYLLAPYLSVKEERRKVGNDS